MAEEDGTRTGRRALLKGAAVGGAAAWVAPMVLAQPAAAASPPPTPTTTQPPSGCGSELGGVFTIPAFAQASFVGMLISGCNSMIWGIEVDGVSVASGSNSEGVCDNVYPSNVTIPPASTARTARMYLRDETCFVGAAVTYWTDHTSTGGNASVDHALVEAAEASSWTVWLTDAGGGCGARDSNHVPVPNADYNFTATVLMICAA